MNSFDLMCGFDDPIRQFQADLNQIAERAERLRPIVNACNDAIDRSGCKVTLAVGKCRPTRPQVELLITVDRLDETVPLFRELAKEGLRTDTANTHTDAKMMDIIPLRQYHLGPDVTVIAMLLGAMKEEAGENCRMEQVGVKEVPIYEIVCD